MLHTIEPEEVDKRREGGIASNDASADILYIVPRQMLFANIYAGGGNHYFWTWDRDGKKRLLSDVYDLPHDFPNNSRKRNFLLMDRIETLKREIPSFSDMMRLGIINVERVKSESIGNRDYEVYSTYYNDRFVDIYVPFSAFGRGD